MTANPFKVLVLDLDGTAVVHGGGVSDADRRASERLRALGVSVTIATGRLFSGTEAAAQALGVDGHVAVMNGSEHVHAPTRAVARRWTVAPRMRRAAREAFADAGLRVFLFTSDGIHHDDAAAPAMPYLRIFSPALHRHRDVLEAPGWETGDDVLSVCASGPEADIVRAAERLTPLLPDGTGLIHFPGPPGERFLEIRRDTEDKGTALVRLAEERGVTAAETVAVGDWINDVSMLKAAGRAYAMGGADPVAVAAADEVLPAERGRGGAVEAVAKLVWGV